MADIVIEYDRVDTTRLARSVQDLERRGYHIWLDVPESAVGLTKDALKKQFGTVSGLYSVYSEDPIGHDDLRKAIRQFGDQQADKGANDPGAVTLFACLKGTPDDFPASFRRISGRDMDSIEEGIKVSSGAGAVAVSEEPAAAGVVRTEQPTANPGLLIERVMSQRTTSAMASSANGFQIRLAPNDVDHAGNVLRPTATRKTAATSQVLAAVAPTQPAPQPAAPAPSASAPADHHASGSLLSFVHLMAGLTLALTVVTFVVAAFIFASSERSHLSTIAFSGVFAFVPFVIYRLLKAYERRLKAAEQAKSKSMNSLLMA